MGGASEREADGPGGGDASAATERSAGGGRPREPRRPSVWLVGMMGCGKSTVGPRLARRLGLPFVDTDRVIEEQAGRSVGEIFAREGEARFRALEIRAIEEIAARPAVVALGGGAMAQPGAPERLRALGQVVYLRAAPRVLARRVGRGEDRPLLADLSAKEQAARLAELLAERSESYEQAQIVVETDSLDPDQVVEAIVERLEAEGVSS